MSFPTPLYAAAIALLTRDPVPKCPTIPSSLVEAAVRSSAPPGHRRYEEIASWAHGEGLEAGKLIGADRELRGCCEYIAGSGGWFANPEHRVNELLLARRPNIDSPVLRGLAVTSQHRHGGVLTAQEIEVLRTALEAKLND